MITGRRLPSPSMATHLKRRAIYPESAWSSVLTRWAQCSPNRQVAAELRLVLLLLCPYKVISAREEAEVAVGSIQKGETLCALSRYCGWDFRVCRSRVRFCSHRELPGFWRCFLSALMEPPSSVLSVRWRFVNTRPDMV